MPYQLHGLVRLCIKRIGKRYYLMNCKRLFALGQTPFIFACDGKDDGWNATRCQVLR